MLKEKLNMILKTDEGNSKKKIENLVFLLIILIVTILAINFIWNDKEKNRQFFSVKNKNEIEDVKDVNEVNNESLELKLKKILSKITGVGRAEVMITYSESTQVIPVYNKKEKTSNTDESDSGGGTRKVEEIDSSEEVVYTENTGKGEIVTQKTISPKVEGAIVICDGADNSDVKTNVIQAVEAVTGLATHKIQVFKSQN